MNSKRYRKEFKNEAVNKPQRGGTRLVVLTHSCRSSQQRTFNVGNQRRHQA